MSKTKYDCEKAIAVLIEFVEDIESTGGLEWNIEERQYGPAGDIGWTALATTYVHACEVLGCEPLKDQKNADAEDSEIDDCLDAMEDEHDESDS